MDNKWIKVENEPEINEWIFIYIGSKTPVMGCYKGNGKVLDNSLNEIWDFKEDDIRFWQPLPLPPAEEPVSNESISEDEIEKIGKKIYSHYNIWSPDLKDGFMFGYKAAISSNIQESGIKISEDELFKKFLPYCNFDKKGQPEFVANKLIEIAKSYTNSKLEELEKWIYGNNLLSNNGIVNVSVTKLIEKIKSLK